MQPEAVMKAPGGGGTNCHSESREGLPEWPTGKEATCQCSGRGSDP